MGLPVQVVVLMKVKGSRPKIFSAKNPEISSFTDDYLWKLENEKLKNRYSGLQWKFGNTLWGIAESLENLLESKCGKFCLVEWMPPNGRNVIYFMSKGAIAA